MKTYMLIFLALVGCGKKSTTPFYNPSVSELSLDRDGDGLSDLAELSQGQDPLVANVPSGRAPVIESVVFTDFSAHKFDMQAKARGGLRRWLVSQAIDPETMTKELAPVTGPVLDFSADPLFWEWYDRGFEFQKLRISSAGPVPKNGESYWSKEHNLDRSQLAQGKVVLPSVLNAKRVQQLMANDYQLIVSTPAWDEVYYIHPDLTPLEFLKSRYAVTTDESQRLTALDDQGLKLGNEWRTLNMGRTLHVIPQAGQTYALVLTRPDEFAPSKQNEWRLEQGTVTLSLRLGQKLQLKIENKEQNYAFDSRNPHNSWICKFTTVEALGRKPEAFASTDELLKNFELVEGSSVRSLQNNPAVKIQWERILSQTQTLRLKIRSEDSGAFIRVRSPETTRIGIAESSCGSGPWRPQYQSIPIWEGIDPVLIFDESGDE